MQFARLASISETEAHKGQNLQAFSGLNVVNASLIQKSAYTYLYLTVVHTNESVFALLVLYVAISSLVTSTNNVDAHRHSNITTLLISLASKPFREW